MATQVTQSTFLSNYNDDWRDSDHYHRILFNNGRALQARELTQSQTIIQEEIAKLAGFIFREGGIFNTSYGAISAGPDALGFVKVDSLPTGYGLLVDQEVENPSGVTAIIKAIVPASGSDNNTLLVKYVSSNNNTSTNTATGPRIFEAGEALTYNTGSLSGTLNVQTTDTSANPATGKGSFVEVPQFNTFVAGHIIMVEKQSLVISKYSSSPDAVIGFKLTEEIITATDDIALYDNSGSTPNLTSPGADRYKITMTLIDKANVSSGDTFYPLYEIKKGVARALQSKDNLLSEVGDILAGRTENITGNFVVRDNPFGEFDVEVAEDSESTHLLYKVSGGVGYIKGNRIERPVPETIRVQKPRSLIDDLHTKTNEFISARYGNFFLATTAKGLVERIDNLGSINLYSATNRGGSIIGSARIRGMDEYDNDYRIHVFDVKMDSSAGSPYSVGAVRSVGWDADNFANLTAISGRYDLYDKEENSLLFELPRTRVYEISNVTMSVGTVATTTSDGSGNATFTQQISGSTLTDQENWIVSVDSSGELFSPPSVSGTPSTSALITGLPFNSAVTMLQYEQITAQRKTKSLNTGRVQSGLSLSSGKFELDRTDIYKFTSVVDDTTSEDITHRFRFDNGQRDDFYMRGSGKLKPGASSPAGTVTVTYDWFSHSDGDYFGGKASYPDIEYENIPTYVTSTGKEYILADVIDMRPSKSRVNNDFSSSTAVIEPLPKNTGLITIGTAKYYQPRVDTITLGPDGSINVYNGKTQNVPKKSANISKDDMLLHNITLAPYVIGTTDVLVEDYDNLGYKMSDIQRLEKRIDNLEEAVTITQAELDTVRLTVPDPTDATYPDRIKLGLTADGFTNNQKSKVNDPDYRAMINRDAQIMKPMGFKRQIGLYYDSDLSTGVVKKGNSVWPKYTEEVMIDQTIASKYIDVNQFEISKSKGAGIMEPDLDTWRIRKKVDESYQVDQTESYLPKGSTAVSSQGEGQGS